jgi:Helix-turn-helix domain
MLRPWLKSGRNLLFRGCSVKGETALRVQLDDNLRAVLRAGRKRSGDISQVEAARRAGISAIWWAQLEGGGGGRDITRVDTFTSMAEAVGISPQVLIRAGYPQLAIALEQRIDWFGGDMFSGVKEPTAAARHPHRRRQSKKPAARKLPAKKTAPAAAKAEDAAEYKPA